MNNSWITDNYKELTNYAKSNYSYLEKKGISINEVINEAIISIYDQNPFPETEQDYVDAVKKSMNVVYFHEKELLKDSNYIVKKSTSKDSETYSLTDKVTKNIEELDPYLVKVCNLFYLNRFGKKDEKKVCNKCGAKRFYVLPETTKSKQVLKCCACGYKMGINARTYNHCAKLKNTVFYNFIKKVCKNKCISTHELGRQLNITQKTSYYRKKLVLSAILTIKSTNPNKVLYKILTNKEKDENKLKFVKRRKRGLSINQRKEIVRLHNLGYKNKELSEMFKKDRSYISKVYSNNQ